MYCSKEHRTYLEVLQDFHHPQPPLDQLLDVIPRLQPRQFSIASSLEKHPGRLQLCVAVVAYKTPTKRFRRGLCSSWLASLQLGQQVPLWVRANPAMRVPADPNCPLLLVGPGTGVAPLRAILEERASAREAGTKQGEQTLLFGCRKRTADFLYGCEFEDLQQRQVLQGLWVAFSRDQPKKVYVQHKIAEYAKDVWRIVAAENSHFYLCGSAGQMPKEVREAVIEAACMGVGKLSEEEAHALLKRMEKEKRWHVETWS